MVNCCVVGCKSRNTCQEENVTFHRFNDCKMKRADKLLQMAYKGTDYKEIDAGSSKTRLLAPETVAHTSQIRLPQDEASSTTNCNLPSLTAQTQKSQNHKLKYKLPRNSEGSGIDLDEEKLNLLCKEGMPNYTEKSLHEDMSVKERKQVKHTKNEGHTQDTNHQDHIENQIENQNTGNEEQLQDTTRQQTKLSLICEEVMPNSIENNFYEDSDDSVLDKDYVPSPIDSDSTNSNMGNDTNFYKQRTENEKQIWQITEQQDQIDIYIGNEEHLLQVTEQQDQIENQNTRSEEQLQDTTRQQNQIHVHTGNEEHLLQVTEQQEQIDEQLLTKKGTVRKRKKIDTSVKERKQEKLRNLQLKRSIKSPCGDQCPKKCRISFNQEDRQKIHDNYVSLDWEAQGVMIKSLVSQINVQGRKKVNKENKYKRNKTYKYYLPTTEDQKNEVCKTFFLTTLGYNKKNDKRLLKILEKDLSDQKDKRGTHENRKKIDRNIVEQHILEYNPAVSHYRREHAPRRRYFPSDVTLQTILEDYKKQYPTHEISYDFLRQFIKKEMNISFANLTNEECESCTTFEMHKKESKHTEPEMYRDCQHCENYLKHKKRYTESRKMYQKDVETQEKNENKDCIYYSVDLQKVIMLPRMDMYKIVLFTPRIICFNESFVPLGKFTDTLKPIAVLWNEVISGRKQEDIISAFRAFLMEKRDDKNIVLWADNCSSQNKSWALMTFLVQVINSEETSAETIIIKYFEPGHSFMSADSFHHLVEKSLQKKKKVYDYNDFVNCVEESTNKVVIKKMEVSDFFLFQDKSSQHKLRNSQPRVFLKDIAAVLVKRGDFDIQYKTSHNQENFEKLSFLQMKFIKTREIPMPQKKITARGINMERKKQIIDSICPLMPANRTLFWKNLHVNNAENLAFGDDNGENEGN